MTVRVLHGDCLDHMRALAGEGFRAHACVTDLPYGLGFMGKAWDAADNVAFRADTWRAVMACLRPGAFVAAFGGTRQWHRMACAMEDAGLEIRDTVFWLYGTGFPKNKSALKPAVEPITLARVPLIGTVAQNVEAHGCGLLGIDACRIEASDKTPAPVGQFGTAKIDTTGHTGVRDSSSDHLGRWPANLVHDGSDEVEVAFAAFGERAAGRFPKNSGGIGTASGIYGQGVGRDQVERNLDSGSASRFFYSAKASKIDRADSKHPTVKPTALMEWLVQLVTPPSGIVLDPFAGTGSTGLAAARKGYDAMLIEQDAQYVEDIRRKLDGGMPLFTQAFP